VIVSAFRLEDALALLADLVDTPEDATIRYGGHVIGVVHGPDRQITRLDTAHRSAAGAA
jgi:hypothetical protein